MMVTYVFQVGKKFTWETWLESGCIKVESICLIKAGRPLESLTIAAGEATKYSPKDSLLAIRPRIKHEKA